MRSGCPGCCKTIALLRLNTKKKGDEFVRMNGRVRLHDQAFFHLPFFQLGFFLSSSSSCPPPKLDGAFLCALFLTFSFSCFVFFSRSRLVFLFTLPFLAFSSSRRGASVLLIADCVPDFSHSLAGHGGERLMQEGRESHLEEVRGRDFMSEGKK